MKVDIIKDKQKTLQSLKLASSLAIDSITTTINQLSFVNEKIDKSINEIEEAKLKLQTTEDELNTTKTHNIKVINKFRALIEE